MEKQSAYINFLQKNITDMRDHYIEKRNIAKSIIRKIHQSSWDRFMSNVEHDIHGR